MIDRQKKYGHEQQAYSAFCIKCGEFLIFEMDTEEEAEREEREIDKQIDTIEKVRLAAREAELKACVRCKHEAQQARIAARAAEEIEAV